MDTANANAATDEKLQPLIDAVRAVIPGDTNPSTPWRWAIKGIAGLDGERIKLQIWYVGRAPHTTQAAARQWLKAVTEARLERMTRTQQRADDVICDDLEAVGLTNNGR